MRVHYNIPPFSILAFFLGHLLVHHSGGQCFGALHTDVDGVACQVILPQNTQLVGEAEQNVACCLLRGVVGHGEHLVGGVCGARKERGECLVLLSQLAEHELQLCTVLGSIVGLATHQGVRLSRIS